VTGDVLIHPAAGLPDAYDAAGQGWLPPVWLWPTPPWRGCWEYQHEPEYLVITGRALNIGMAQLMLNRADLLATYLLARENDEVTPELVARISAMRWKIIDDPVLSEGARNFMHEVRGRA
jgi:hypothetical protein